MMPSQSKEKRKNLSPAAHTRAFSVLSLTRVVMCDDHDMFSMMVIPRDLKLFTSSTLNPLM